MYDINETGRIESFSDGVFAIAMTLLVIEIKVPGHEEVARSGLLRSLIDNWPSFLAFLTSFVTVLVIWVHHHRIFALLSKCDHKLFYYNGLLLFFVSFLPFPTALLSEYLLYREARVAANLYTGIFLAISISYDLLWRHVSKRLLTGDVILLRKEEALEITTQYKFGPPLYLGAFGMSFVSEPLSLTMCLLLALFFTLRGWPFKEPV
jgi:uncharacterized membrane protein